MTDTSRNEAVEKLNQGIQESRQAAQQQTMKLAQEYFEDSVEELRQQVRDRRATLERLPNQVPGGREEGFQESFGQLMERYSRLEACLTDARNNTDTRSNSNTGSESSGRREEVDATDAARREAQRLGIDITQVKGTGAGGRIVVWDVTELVEEGDQGQSGKSDQASQQVKQATGQAQQAAAGAVTEGFKATDAAKRKAQEAGVDLSEVEGTGSEGNIVVDDVTNLADKAKSQGTGLGEDLFG
jgi:pyruvate/2-oxoglutarate dehydrogenase complex dihydrolipoamide acyltransferase (E2) component